MHFHSMILEMLHTLKLNRSALWTSAMATRLKMRYVKVSNVSKRVKFRRHLATCIIRWTLVS